jgi:soluble lytic murein transglycosylase-like protein
MVMNGGQSFGRLGEIFSRINSLEKHIDELQGKESKDDPSVDQLLGDYESKDNEFSFSSILGSMRGKLPQKAQKFVVEDAIQRASKDVGIDDDLLRAIIQVESGGNSSAVSGAGAKGLMQLIDSTAHSMGVVDPFDPHQNVMGGAKYIKNQLEKFGGNLRLALAAYNAGPGAVEKYRGIPPFPETVNYVRNVENIYRNLKFNS